MEVHDIWDSEIFILKSEKLILFRFDWTVSYLVDIHVFITCIKLLTYVQV